MPASFLLQPQVVDIINSSSKWLNHHAVRVAIILILGLVAQQFLRLLTHRIKATIHKQSEGSAANRASRAQTLAGVFSTTASGLVWSIVLLMILDQLGVNIGPVIASAGIVGFAIGFGSQELVKDIISGFFFLYENQFNVGDYIVVKNFEGTVREMNLRSVRLRGQKGERIIIRNSQIDVVTRLSHPPEPEGDANAKA